MKHADSIDRCSLCGFAEHGACAGDFDFSAKTLAIGKAGETNSQYFLGYWSLTEFIC